MGGNELKYFSEEDVDTWQKNTATRFGELVTAAGGRTRACQIIGSVNRDTISNWSTGKSRLPLYAACRLCETTGKSLEWLATGLEGHTAHAPAGLYQKVHEQLISYFNATGVSNVPLSTLAKLCGYLTRRIEQQQLKTESFDIENINLKEFQEEITLVVGQ